MKDVRIIRLLKTFSSEELKSFGKFIKSPFLKPARDTTMLYDYLIKFHPDYDSKNLGNEKVFKKLYIGEKYNEKKLFNIIFDMTKAAEKFIAYNTLLKDETEFLLNLSKGFLNKKLSNESFRINNLIEKILKPGFSPDKDYISKLRRLTFLQSSYYTEKNDFEKAIESAKKYFEASAVQFIIDYIQIVSSMKPAQNTYGKTIESNFIRYIFQSFDYEKLIKLLEKEDFAHTPLIALHYYKLKTIEEPDNLNHYFLLKEFFYKNLSKFDQVEKTLVFSHLANYCIQKISFQNLSFKREGLEIYKYMMENKAYSYSNNEYMDVMTYRNIILFCISVKEFEWFEYFIEKYNECVPPVNREELKNFAYAHLFFMKKEYLKSLTSTSKINHEFFLFKTDLKNLLLKIYYELDYFDQAFSLVDAYKHFLASNKDITKPFKETFINYLNFYFELLKIKSGQSKELPLFVKNNIEKENQIINKVWLIEKATELIKLT